MSGDEGRRLHRPRAIQRPRRIVPGPLRELKDLIYELYLAAGTPPLDTISAWVAEDDGLPGAPSRDTVHRILGQNALPPSQADVQSVAAVLARAGAWDERDAVRRIRDLWVQARLDVGIGTPLAQLTDPFAFEVHRTIEVTQAQADDLPVLPPYIARPHDIMLARAVEIAAQGRSEIAILVGGSSTGKTRACWEAVTAVNAFSGEWRLWHPISPGRSQALLEGLAKVGPHTVVWLNEAQHYLLTPGNDLGEQVAAGLRELLRDPDRAPVLIVGTLWPEYWDTLTTQPGVNGADLHAQARMLLAGADIAVPDTFAGEALAAARVLGARDPRLAQAADQADSGQVTQYLAGVPELVHRYQNAPPAAKALIHAAMDARRLGCGVALPGTLVLDAASGYLTDQQWDELADNWFESVLAYCAKPCRGTRGPLTRIRQRPGRPAVDQPTYRLADYLEQIGRSARGAMSGPAALWDSIAVHTLDEDRERLATAARDRGLYRHALRICVDTSDHSLLWKAAVDLETSGRVDDALEYFGHAADLSENASVRTAAICSATGMLVRTARVDKAIEWLAARAGEGDRVALREAARTLNRAGRIDEALRFYEPAANLDDLYAVQEAANMLAAAGRNEEAIAWLTTRAENGNPNAQREAARMLDQAGRIDEALKYYGRAARNNMAAVRFGVRMLGAAGRVDDAVEWLKTRPVGDNINVQWESAELLKAAGRTDEALDYYGRAADSGEHRAVTAAAELLIAMGRVDEASTLLTTRGNGNDSAVLKQAADMLQAAGRIDEALEHYGRAADSGASGAVKSAAVNAAVRMLAIAARGDDAINWLMLRAEAGDVNARWALVRDLKSAGRTEDAINWLISQAEAGSDFAQVDAVWELEAAGRAGDAIAWLVPRADSGDQHASETVAGLLSRMGRVDEALEYYARAAHSGSHHAAEYAVKMLGALGRVDDAITWLAARPDNESVNVHWEAAELLNAAGRIDEALERYGRAADAGDRRAVTAAAEMLTAAGRIEEGQRLRQFGREPIGQISEPWNASDP